MKESDGQSTGNGMIDRWASASLSRFGELNHQPYVESHGGDMAIGLGGTVDSLTAKGMYAYGVHV